MASTVVAAGAGPSRKGRALADGELIKHSAAIQATNSLSLLQRKVANVCLMRAFPRLGWEEVHQLSLRELKRELGYRSHNDDKLRAAFRALNGTQIEWNLFGKDRAHRWGIASLMAQAEFIDGCICEYAYPPKLRQLFAQPEVYARLNLKVQNGFTSKHSLALWEFLVDALGSKRKRATVHLDLAQFRRLLAIGEGEYGEFKALRRRVIEVAVGEINASGDLSVVAEYRRKGRAVAGIDFRVEAGDARPPMQALEAHDSPASPAEQARARAEPRDQETTLIEEFGVARGAARRLIAQHAPDYISDVLTHVREASRQGRVRALAGYTVRAIERDFRSATTTPPAAVAAPISTEARPDHETARAEQEGAFQAWREEAAEAALATLDPSERDAVDNRVRLALQKTAFGRRQLEALDAGDDAARATYLQVAADLVLESHVARDFAGFVARKLTQG